MRLSSSRVGGIAGLAALLASCVSMVDYMVPLRLDVRAESADGRPLENTAVALADGLAERPLGYTDGGGALSTKYALVWGHKKGAKPGPPPEVTVRLRHPDCITASVKRVVAPPVDADGFHRIEVRISLRCGEPPAAGSAEVQ